MTVVPEPNSRWEYDGKPIRVHGVVVNWDYEKPSDKSMYSPTNPQAMLSCFQEGGSFTPLPDDIEVGKTYFCHDYEFYVFEVDEGRVYGKERTIDSGIGHWYGESYNLHDFRTSFKVRLDNG